MKLIYIFWDAHHHSNQSYSKQHYNVGMLFDGATLSSSATACWAHWIGDGDGLTIRTKRECIIVSDYQHPPRITARIGSAWECASTTTYTTHTRGNCVDIRRTACQHHLSTQTAANWCAAAWAGCVSAGPCLRLSCTDERCQQQNNQFWLLHSIRFLFVANDQDAWIKSN